MLTERIGLDIGRTAIKAVRLRRTLTGQESITFLKQDLPRTGEEGLDPAHVAIQLRQFIKTHKLAGAHVVSALACRDLFIRTLELPFTDPKKLVQVVPYEVENLIPLPLEDVAVDYQVLGPSGDQPGALGKAASDVLVAAVPRTKLSEHLHLLTEAGLEADLIDVDALALYSYAQHLAKRGAVIPPHLAMIDIGATKTTLCLTHEGRPRVIRTLGWGSRQLTQALAERDRCSWDEAEQLKQRLTVRDLDPWFTSLIRDLQITLHGYETATQTRLRHIWVTGGGSELVGLAPYLAGELELEPLAVGHNGKPLCPPAFAIAFGLAAKPQRLRLGARVGGTTSVAINLNRVSDAAVAKQAPQRRDWLAAGVGLLCLGLLGLGDLALGVHLRETRLQGLNGALQSQFAAAFPGLAAGGDTGLDEVDQAQSTLAAAKKTLALLGGDQPRMVPLLADLVHQLPKTVPLKLHALTLERTSLQMEGETDSFDAVEKITQALRAFPDVQDVTVSDTRVGATPNQVRFRANLVVHTP